MTDIPENAVTVQDLHAWYEMQEQLKKLKAAEMLLRKKLFGHYFAAPKEGTNTAPLADGWVLKGKHTITRDVDLGALTTLTPTLHERGIRVDQLVQYKPSLVMLSYKTLTEEERCFFDQVLIVKPGSPALEIVLPAKARKAGDVAVQHVPSVDSEGGVL